jgi:hypothetical protein
MASLRDATEARYVRLEAEQFALFAPPLAASAGRAALEEAVWLALRMARRAGFTDARQIRLCWQLMTSFGSHFDTDPQYQWLHPFLDMADSLDARERARLLRWHSTLYLNRAYGKNGVYGIAAAVRVSELDTDMLAEVGADYRDRGLDLLARIHPERLAWLSAPILHWLLDKAAEDAKRHGLGGVAAAPLLLCLMFCLGHGVADDPLYPWVREALSNAAPSGPEKTAALVVCTRATVSSMSRQLKEARH